jgi:hypothetical protein
MYLLGDQYTEFMMQLRQFSVRQTAEEMVRQPGGHA